MRSCRTELRLTTVMQTFSIAVSTIIALIAVVRGRTWRWKTTKKPSNNFERTDSAYTSTSDDSPSSGDSEIAMGCTQSVPGSGSVGRAGGSPNETSAGKQGQLAPSAIRVSFNGKTTSSSGKQVRDSVNDISGGDEKALKEGRVDSNGSCATGANGAETESDPKTHPRPSAGAASTSSGQRNDSKDQPLSPGPVSTPAYTPSPLDSPGIYSGGGQRARNSTDKHGSSNRSSFAAEALPARLVQARGSRGDPGGVGGGAGGAGGGRASSGDQKVVLPAALEAARSSAQARMSSIQAADVMGLGGHQPSGAARGSAMFDPLPGFHPPPEVAAAYPLLGALPPDTPVPVEVLQRLWKAGSLQEALGVARSLASAGILRLASLEDGSCWALPAPQHVAHAAAVWPGVAAVVHGQLVEGYTRRGAVPLEGLRDDGYIVQALSHHLVGCGRLDSLRQLLMNPGWLEAKLHAYGVGAVVRDFRRYLQDACNDEEAHDVKLLLQAFQLSLGAAMEHPTARMMREQMLARLMAVAAGGRLKEWFADQTAKCAAEGMLAASSRLLHLMPRSPSLAQAGGVQRMTLRGHQAPVTRVAIAPNCCDVITISEDGSAQAWDMNIGDCVMHLARDAPLTAVGVTPDSAAAVVAAADGTAAVWSLTAGQITHTFKGHTGRITCLAIDKQGIRVVTGSEDHTGRVWNLQSGECEAVLRGHGGAAGLVGCILDVCVCSDGTLAATVSEDFSGRVWDLDEDGEQLHVLEGHGGWVTSAAFVGTSHRLVTASHDSTARIWDALKGRCLFVLTGHTGRINRVSVDPGGSWAVTVSDDNTARVWDCETGASQAVLEGHSAHVTDAAVTRDCRKVVTVSGDGTAAIWDLATGAREAVLEGHTGEVAAVALTQRGRFAVTAGEDCTARVWDLAAAAEAPPPQPTHGGKVSALQALPDGQLVVSAGDDGRVLLWDPIEGVCLKRMEGHRAGVRFMRVSADGERVLTGSGDRQICAWNWAEYSACASVVGQRRSLERRDLMLHTLATGYGSTGSQATTTGPGAMGGGGGGGGGGGTGRALGTQSPLLSTSGTEYGGGAGGGRAGEGGDGGAAGAAAAAAPGGAAAAALAAAAGGADPAMSPRSSEDDPMVALAALKPSGGRTAAPRVAAAAGAAAPPPVRLQSFSSIAAAAAAAAAGGTGANSAAPSPKPGGGGGLGSAPGTDTGMKQCRSLLEMVQSVQHEPLHASMPAQQGSRVKHMAFDGACRVAAVLLFDSTVSVWDVATGRCVSQLIRRGERDATRTHSGGVNAVHLTKDGRTAVTISKDNTARVWDVESATTRYVVEGHTDGLVAADMSADEALLATAAYDKTVRVTRLANGLAVAVLDHPQPPTCVCFSPDNRYMAVGLEDHTVVVWDLVGRCCLPSLDAHKAPLTVLTWSPDSRFLLTAGQDCTLRLWRAADGRQHAFFMGDAAMTAACFAGHPIPDIVVAGDAAGTVHFLDFAEELQG